MLFLKKGIDKAAGQPIYPHPRQSLTGNCAAYSGASCLYAFGLDHEPTLIPDVQQGSDAEKFQYKISKMVERLTELIYTSYFASPAKAYRQYIDDAGLGDKFDVTEVPPVKVSWDVISETTTISSNLPYIIEQMKLCQDILLHVKWAGTWWHPFRTSKHSVGLVGIDEDTGELILNNPWGGGIHLNPTDAAANTASGTGDQFTRHKYSIDADFVVHLPIGGYDATIYECVMICPAKPKVAAVESRTSIVDPPSTPRVPSEPEESGRHSSGNYRYDYALTNTVADPINGFAVELGGLGPESIVAIRSPKGWTAAPWYRDRETGFDQPAPDAGPPPAGSSFAGVIWRTAKRPVRPERKRDGFAIEVTFPKSLAESKIAEWRNDPLGHAVLLHEAFGTTTAWHVSAITPTRIKPRIPMQG